MYYNKSLKKYLDDLAARLPAPGGGSAAALGAALGAALISMVVNFTLGKPKYLRYEKRLKQIILSSEKLRKKFLDLVDEDILAFKNKDAQKSLALPFRLCRYCREAIKLCPDLVLMGNVNLISDVAVAAILLESAFFSAYYNVEINLRGLKNQGLAKDMRKILFKDAGIVRRVREKTEVKVGKIIGR